MHQHVYTGGAIRDDIVTRYCSCGITIIYIYNKNIKIFEMFTDDQEYYQDMAKQLLTK